jgi:hypothetical protein
MESNTASERFVPKRATLCTRKDNGAIFAIFFSSKGQPQVDCSLTKMKNGKLKFDIAAQPKWSDAKTQSLSAQVFTNHPKWNNILDWCVQEELLTLEEAEQAKV